MSKKPYSASLMGKSLGNYAVPEHAALVRARAMGPEASHRAAKEEEAKIAATQAAPLTKEEALAAAEAEGLTLVPNTSTSGYKYVTVASGSGGARTVDAGYHIRATVGYLSLIHI